MYTKHGGDWAGYLAEYGRPALDFSANLSPLGMPRPVALAARRALKQSEAYPDPLCRALTGAIAAREGVPGEWVLCGGGAADLIFRLALAAKPAFGLVTAPAFGEYESALAAADLPVERYFLKPEKDFQVDEGFLSAIRPGALVFLCEPNNPTGLLTPRPLLLRALETCRARGATLVADECFLDFLPEGEALTLRPELAGGGLVILRSFTKMYAMAGLRLGYCLSAQSALLARMAEAGAPWSVSTPAQAAGLAALSLPGWPARVRRAIAPQRAYLARGLAARGCRVFPGRANYLFFKAPLPDLPARLKEQGVLIRDCSGYPGLGPGYCRAAVRPVAESRALFRAMDQVLRDAF